MRLAHVLHRFRSRCVHNEYIVGGHGLYVHVERFGAVDQMPGMGKVFRRRLRISVILQHEQNRQRPQRGHVQALVDHTLAHRAVPHEDDGDRPGRQLLGSQSGADRVGNDAALNPVCVHVVLVEVLRAAGPSAYA